MSRVWILGAGASRSLGAPLLGDLFSEELGSRVYAAFPEATFSRLYTAASRRVFQLYREHGRGPGAQWADAEDFLDRLDVAARQPNSATARWLASLLGGSPNFSEFSAAAKRLVAAQCSAFLEGADSKTERWDPYRHWASRLGAGDTVVTFNYDRVLEMVTSRLDVIKPGDREPFVGPALLKLHGSVDWLLRANGAGSYVEVRPDLPHAALQFDDEALAIASPGPSKKEIASSAFSSLWEHAVRQLRSASEVIFLGYRFPPSDSSARRILLDALGASEAAHLAIHTVLGSDIRHQDSERLKGLLGAAATQRGRTPNIAMRGVPGVKTFSLTQHPLFAQDFMDLVEFFRLDS